MIQLSNGDVVAVLGLVGLVIFIASLGLLEVFMYGNFKVANTTWVFAVVPVLAVFIIIVADSGIHPLLRVLLVAVWAFLVAVLWKFVQGQAIRILTKKMAAKQ